MHQNGNGFPKYDLNWTQQQIKVVLHISRQLMCSTAQCISCIYKSSWTGCMKCHSAAPPLHVLTDYSLYIIQNWWLIFKNSINQYFKWVRATLPCWVHHGYHMGFCQNSNFHWLVCIRFGFWSDPPANLYIFPRGGELVNRPFLSHGGLCIIWYFIGLIRNTNLHSKLSGVQTDLYPKLWLWL